MPLFDNTVVLDLTLKLLETKRIDLDLIMWVDARIFDYEPEYQIFFLNFAWFEVLRRVNYDILERI